MATRLRLKEYLQEIGMTQSELMNLCKDTGPSEKTIERMIYNPTGNFELASINLIIDVLECEDSDILEFLDSIIQSNYDELSEQLAKYHHFSLIALKELYFMFKATGLDVKLQPYGDFRSLIVKNRGDQQSNVYINFVVRISGGRVPFLHVVDSFITINEAYLNIVSISNLLIDIIEKLANTLGISHIIYQTDFIQEPPLYMENMNNDESNSLKVMNQNKESELNKNFSINANFKVYGRIDPNILKQKGYTNFFKYGSDYEKTLNKSV